MLQQVLPWAEEHPKLFLASLVFWLLLPLSIGVGVYFVIRAFTGMP